MRFQGAKPEVLAKGRVLFEDLVLPRRKPAPIDTALREAVAWIYRAQDSTADRGVSHSYLLGKRWAPSYPETTGYIIPTLLNYWKVSGESEARDRALQMADWECEVQLDDGSVMASVVGTFPAKSCVFDTGQVIFGWLAAHKATGDGKYLLSSARAMGWLVDRLRGRDTWETHGNMGADRAHTYHVRVLWAMLHYATVTADDRDAQAVRTAVDWAISQEKSPGWFDNNCLTKNDQPLLHTIAYTAQGLLESGLLLDDARCIDSARRTADALIARVHPDGRMAGRFDSQWRERARWACLTGIAQMSIVWQRLFAITRDDRYRDAAARANGFLRTIQRVRCSNPGVRGGIPGSYPINGDYGRYRILNWATKFYIDALLLEKEPSWAASGQAFPG